MLTIAEELLIIESLDKPFQLEPAAGQDVEFPGITNGKLYRVPDTEHAFITFKREGQYEIHHQFGEQVGVMTGLHDSGHQFIATAFHLAKNLVDAGHSVRIVSPVESPLRNHYRRIGNILAKKHKLYVTSPKPSSDISGVGKDLEEFSIHPHGYSITGIVHKTVMESRSEENDYTGMTFEQVLAAHFTQKEINEHTTV